jgi:hypothetical protein
MEKNPTGMGFSLCIYQGKLTQLSTSVKSNNTHTRAAPPVWVRSWEASTIQVSYPLLPMVLLAVG